MFTKVQVERDPQGGALVDQAGKGGDVMPQALKPRSARPCDEKAVSRGLTYNKWNLSSRGSGRSQQGGGRRWEVSHLSSLSLPSFPPISNRGSRVLNLTRSQTSGRAECVVSASLGWSVDTKE